MPQRESITFEIPSIPPSSNHAIHTARNGRRYPSPKLKAWQQICRSLPIQQIKKAQWYGVELFFYFPLFYKNGNVRRADRGNLVKYAEDEIAKRLITYDGEPLDDKLFKTAVSEKVDSDITKTIITVYCI